MTLKKPTTDRSIPSPRDLAGRGPGRGGAKKSSSPQVRIARQLRRTETKEEKQLWHSLKAGRFAGFKFRRQHALGKYYLDFYCPVAKLSIELDGFQHGLPADQIHDLARKIFLESKGIEEVRFWNHQWRENRDGILIDIWEKLHHHTGCVSVVRKVENHRFTPPDPDRMISSTVRKIK